MIPEQCPSCQETDGWKEVVNPFTTGIPIGKNMRINIGIVRTGCFGFYKVKYRCEKCGFEDKYDYREDK
ncbi:MAG: hypothetical protein IKJ69_04855 [Clostridia bacterium]|nr:hypothetical protein [Clostridia bacterium]